MFEELTKWLLNYYYPNNSIGLMMSDLIKDGGVLLLNITIALIIKISIITYLIIKVRTLNRIKTLYYENREEVYETLFNNFSSLINKNTNQIKNVSREIEQVTSNNLNNMTGYVQITKEMLDIHQQDISDKLQEESIKVDKIQKISNKIIFSNADLKVKVKELNSELKNKDKTINKLNKLLLDKLDG